MRVTPRDIIIGVLVAYVVSDVLLSLLLRSDCPSLLVKLGQSLKSQSGMMAVAIGVLVGVMVAYLSASLESGGK